MNREIPIRRPLSKFQRALLMRIVEKPILTFMLRGPEKRAAERMVYAKHLIKVTGTQVGKYHSFSNRIYYKALEG